MEEPVQDFYDTYREEILSSLKIPCFDDEAEQIGVVSQENEEPPRKRHANIVSFDDELIKLFMKRFLSFVNVYISFFVE